MTSECGHIEIVQALLTAPGIDINHANVSIYSLTPSHVVVVGSGRGGLPFLLLHPNPCTNVLSPLNLENVSHHYTSEQYSRSRCVSFSDCICFHMTHNSIFASDVVVTITHRIHRVNR